MRMVLGEDLAAILADDFFIALTSELSFNAWTDTIETPSVGDGSFFKVVNVEASSTSSED
jgi:hypothetical protein